MWVCWGIPGIKLYSVYLLYLPCQPNASPRAHPCLIHRLSGNHPSKVYNSWYAAYVEKQNQFHWSQQKHQQDQSRRPAFRSQQSCARLREATNNESRSSKESYDFSVKTGRPSLCSSKTSFSTVFSRRSAVASPWKTNSPTCTGIGSSLSYIDSQIS